LERRHFIRLNGLALGGLLITRQGAAAPAQPVIAPPSSATAVLDDGEHALLASSDGSFRYRDLVVSFREERGALTVVVDAPSLALRFIRLGWPIPVDGGAVLADEWERVYGDEGFRAPAPGTKMPWYFIHHAAGRTSCFGVRTGCPALCYWQCADDTLHLTLDTRNGGGGVLLGSRQLRAASIVVCGGAGGESVFATARRFCGLLCERPRLARQPVYGINDWYYAYGNNNPDLILRQTALMTDLAPDPANRPFSVVDAGWAQYSPYHPGDGGWMDDFSKPNDKFRDMAALATRIRRLGMRPGLWTRPLCASYKDPARLLLPAIPGRDDPKSPVLDPSIPENLQRIGRNISLYRQWGYELVKHDYTTYDIFGKWGMAMGGDVTSPGWRFSDNTRTTAEIVLGLYRAIREAAGEMYLIGCNTMSHLSAGMFELMRVGDDTSGKEWARTRKMGVNALGFRMIQHNRFYAADGDCVGLTRDIPWERNRQWMQLLAGAGTPLFISAEPDAVGPDQRAQIRASFSLAARSLPAGEPLDWLSNPLPARWRLDGAIKQFDWG